MKQPPRILFLYAHVQPFLLAGISALIKNYGARVLVACWPVPDVAPVKYSTSEHLKILEKTPDSIAAIKKEIFDFDADIIYTSGWMDKDYLKWCKSYKKLNRKVVMGIDNQWKGLFRQHLNCFLSPFFLQRIFTHAWVPGYFQYEYVRRLGFPRKNILTKLYIPDTALFDTFYNAALGIKEQNYPKKLLYVGRLVDHKAGTMLRAFNGLSENELDGWTLTVVGNGPMDVSEYNANRNISFLPFMQQHDLCPIIKDAGAFCLLSTEEPWGMVIQEYAAAGLPMIISEQCGAHYSFLIPGHNGYLCDGNNIDDIKEKIKKMITHSREELLLMGKRSNQLASCDTSDTWAATLMSLYQ